jgi:hypothetical protein
MGTTNVTLAIDEELLLEARVVAARRRTSVSRLVREHLRSLVEQERRRTDAWESVYALIAQPSAIVGEGLPAREELHARGA